MRQRRERGEREQFLHYVRKNLPKKEKSFAVDRRGCIEQTCMPVPRVETYGFHDDDDDDDDGQLPTPKGGGEKSHMFRFLFPTFLFVVRDKVRKTFFYVCIQAD
jgi:hypothetical protein